MLCFAQGVLRGSRASEVFKLELVSLAQGIHVMCNVRVT